MAITYRLAVAPRWTKHDVSDCWHCWESQCRSFSTYRMYCSGTFEPTCAAGQLTRTVPSSWSCVVMLAFAGQVTAFGSGGATGATGRLTFTRGMSLGSSPMYTTSRASGSTAHTADSVTLAQRPATGADEFRW